MYPFGDLPANLAAFCDELRRQHHFRIGPAELRDVAQALDLVDLASERHVRNAMRPVLSSRLADSLVFDRAFDAFFFGESSGLERTWPDRDVPPISRSTPPDDQARADPATRQDNDNAQARQMAVDPDNDLADSESDRSVRRTRYSPLRGEGFATLRLEPVSDEWRDAARMFVRRVRLGVSRRWRPGLRGHRFDLRRTWRASLETGGEALSPRWLERRRRIPRFVVLVDGSRSMEQAAEGAMVLPVALATEADVEAFTFSTTLRRITMAVRQAASGTAARLDLPADAYGGGTKIGASLARFLQIHGGMVRRTTIVFIVSDGLDVGDASPLAGAMADLRRRAASIVWCNPLIVTAGYEPTARGMAVAKPFVSLLTGVPDRRVLADLGRHLKVRA
jgi:uncharacterized protein with von Willebrand factor type A (vWA) domain